MILTEMYFSKSSALMLPKERQALEETLAEAQSVLKEAHSKGVELEFVLEVRDKTLFLLTFILLSSVYLTMNDRADASLTAAVIRLRQVFK